MEDSRLLEGLMEFVRAFGLHHPDRTPCGQPLSVSEAHALSDIADHGPLSAGELAKRLRLEKSTVSRIIAQLQARGWMERTPDAHDRRVALLSLTPTGRAAACALAAARQERFSSLLRRIPSEERPALRRALDVMVGALEAEAVGGRTVAESGEDGP